MNKVLLTGNITRDMEVRELANGKKNGRTSIAVRRNMKNKDGNYDSDFINIKAWDKKCEYLVQYAKKGAKVEIIGRMETGSYDDKDGKKVNTTEVVVEEASVLTYPQNVDNSVDNSANATVNNDFEQVTDEDLPF